jgi:hypothetical protein
MGSFVARNKKHSKNPDDIIRQDYECTKCLKCLKPATSIGCGYVMLGNIKVTAAWCENHGGTGPGLLNQKDKPVGANKPSSIDSSCNCWGGWHEKYGLKTILISRGF